MPRKGVSLLRRDDGANEMGIGKAVEIESCQRKNDIKQVMLEGYHNAGNKVDRESSAIIRRVDGFEELWGIRKER